MNAVEPLAESVERRPTRGKRPRSAITSGRKLFVQGDPNSAWSRRYYERESHRSPRSGWEVLHRPRDRERRWMSKHQPTRFGSFPPSLCVEA